jgi:hypothetical protein
MTGEGSFCSGGVLTAGLCLLPLGGVMGVLRSGDFTSPLWWARPAATRKNPTPRNRRNPLLALRGLTNGTSIFIF